jgi:tetratricopeptide (TPR) repeat protein
MTRSSSATASAFALAAMCCLFACHASERDKSTPAPPSAASPAHANVERHAIELREGDYEAARAEAQRRAVPLFVDVWASWCHTCLSMREYVFPDPALSPLADRFVWLSIDSERADSAAFLARFPARNLPTLFVIDAATQQPLLKWIGAATSGELATLLNDVLADRSETNGHAGEATALWVRGNRASAAGQPDEAIDLYRQALASAPPDWDKRGSALETLSMRLSETKRDAECVELAARETPTMKPGTSLVNVLVNALDAADQLPASAPARKLLPAILQIGTRVAEDRALPVLLDDRSSLFLSLVGAEKDADPQAAKRLAARWSALLDAQAAQAKTAAARRVWDPHRVEAYLALGTPDKAIPMLEQSEREQPADYNPPARLARVYLAIKQLDQAEAAIERALPRCAGPRKLRLFMLQADVLVAANRRPAARAALEQALSFARGLTLSPGYETLRQTIEHRQHDLS